MSTPNCAGCVSVFQFGRKRVFHQVETCLKSSTFFTPSLSKERTEGKNDISGQKRKKIPWHLAMFAENDGRVYCAKPQIFSTFTEAWKHFWKKSKSLPKKKLLCCCFCFFHWGCAPWMFSPFRYLWHHHNSPKPSLWWDLRRKHLRGEAQVWVLFRVVLCCSDSSVHSGLGYFCCRRKLNE